MNAIRHEFNDPSIIGCLFHWKQALRKQLLSLNISTDVIKKLMNSNDGLINLSTVFPIVEIKRKGIPYIRNHFDEGGNKTKFNEFRRYFVKCIDKSYK
jgi:hypothetical protein